MIRNTIPGFGELILEHLVLDFNGTLALDGELSQGVGKRLRELQKKLKVHVVTADTFGTARETFDSLGLEAELEILGKEDHSAAKKALVEKLGADTAAAVGNGRNDVQMLRVAALGVCVCGREGWANEAAAAAQLSCPSIEDALDLFRFPLRLRATLRS